MRPDRAIFLAPDRCGSEMKKEKPNPDGPARIQKRARVLVVDDNDIALTVGEMMVKRLGHEVVTAMDGRDALEEFRRCRFDLILTDREMPNMGGLELLLEVRKVDADVPVIVASGNVNEREKEQLYAAGASHVMQKPFGLKELREVVKGWFPG